MSRLDEAVRSVPAESSPADDDALETADAEIADPNPEGDLDNEGDDSGDDKGRTIENVRGELLRKLEKSNEKLMSELRAMREEATRLRDQYGVPAPATNTNQPKTLDDMTVAELEAAAAQVPEDQKQAFDQYLLERKVQARVDESLNKFQEKNQRQTAEQRFNEQAITRWPELRDRNSDFYRATDRILSEMGAAAASNPRAVLDAANEAGLELGQMPQTGLRRNASSPPRKTPAPGRKTSSGPSSADALPPADQQRIADKLASAMPGRKFTKEQLKRIAERDKMYREQIQTHVRG